jgi:uncharacterized protein with HEPN domain
MSRADSLRLPDYLEHIAEAVDRIHRYVADMEEQAFLDDEKTQDAVVRNFEIIGEAARNIERFHSAFADAHPEVPWLLMVTLRNRVAHGYFLVNYELLWKTIHTDLPPLRETLQGLIDSLDKG